MRCSIGSSQPASTFPFDVALAARFEHLTEHEQIVPGYPLMTRGWAFLDEGAPLRELADRVRRLLAPSPWVTGLNPPGKRDRDAPERRCERRPSEHVAAIQPKPVGLAL